MCVFQEIIFQNTGEEVKGVGVMKDEEVKLEEIESSHTLGGYRRCRCYSACVHVRVRSMSMGWVLV